MIETANTTLEAIRNLQKQIAEEIERDYRNDENDILFRADELLEIMAMEIKNEPKEKELPDSPGYWWEWVEDKDFGAWRITFIVDVGMGAVRAKLEHLCGTVVGGTGSPCPGRWVKTNPPPV
jgi:hypothetical protein